METRAKDTLGGRVQDGSDGEEMGMGLQKHPYSYDHRYTHTLLLFDTRAINRADLHPVTHEGVRDKAESQTQVLRGNAVFEP